MEQKSKITVRQFRLLVALWTIGSSILAVPSLLVGLAKQDAWIAVVLSIGFSLLLVWLYTALGKLYPHMNWIDLNKKMLGRWVGTIVLLNWIMTAFLGGVIGNLSYVGYFMATSFMVDTPIQAFLILFAIIVVMALYYGLETIGRAAEILFLVFIIFFVAMVLFALPQAKIVNIQPVFESGIKPLLHASFVCLSYSGFTLVYFLMIFPSAVMEPRKASRAFYDGTWIGGIILLILTILTVLVLGVDETTRSAYSSYALAKQINIANFITRIEIIMTTMWFISIFFKMVLYFYAVLVGAAQLFALKEYRVLIIPLGIIAVVLSIIIYPNSVYQGKWDSTIWPPYMMVSGLVHPLLLLGIAKVRKRFQKKDSR